MNGSRLSPGRRCSSLCPLAVVSLFLVLLYLLPLALPGRRGRGRCRVRRRTRPAGSDVEFRGGAAQRVSGSMSSLRANWRRQTADRPFLLDHLGIGALIEVRPSSAISSASFGITARALGQSKPDARGAAQILAARNSAGRASATRRGRSRRRRWPAARRPCALPGLTFCAATEEISTSPNMRMTPFHLVGDRLGDVVEAEQPGPSAMRAWNTTWNNSRQSSSFSATMSLRSIASTTSYASSISGARSSREILLAVPGKPRAGSRSGPGSRAAGLGRSCGSVFGAHSIHRLRRLCQSSIDNAG